MDAALFLQKAGVKDANVRYAILQYSTIEDDHIQPFLCAILADLYRLAPEGLKFPSLAGLRSDASVVERLSEVVERLITTSDDRFRYAIRAMSTPRRFDSNLYRSVGRRTDYYSVSRASFDVLVSLSCVRLLSQDAFSLHALVRRAFSGANADRSIHLACYEHFLDSPTNPEEALYHQYFIDESAAEASWADQFTLAVEHHLHTKCAALLSVRKEIGENFCPNHCHLAGRYLASVGEYRRAEEELQSSLSNDAPKIDRPVPEIAALLRYAIALKKLGELHLPQGKLELAEKELRDALRYFDVLATTLAMHSSEQGI